MNDRSHPVTADPFEVATNGSETNPDEPILAVPLPEFPNANPGSLFGSDDETATDTSNPGADSSPEEGDGTFLGTLPGNGDGKGPDIFDLALDRDDDDDGLVNSQDSDRDGDGLPNTVDICDNRYDDWQLVTAEWSDMDGNLEYDYIDLRDYPTAYDYHFWQVTEEDTDVYAYTLEELDDLGETLVACGLFHETCLYDKTGKIDDLTEEDLAKAQNYGASYWTMDALRTPTGTEYVSMEKVIGDDTDFIGVIQYDTEGDSLVGCERHESLTVEGSARH